MIFLDTSAYSALANAKVDIVNVVKSVQELTIPLPVIAELKYGFLKGSKKDINEKNLQRFLAQSNVSIAIPSYNTTSIYSELQFYCSKNGKVLSHNDLWIAALAKEVDGILVTYDQDFMALKGLMHEKLCILKTA